MERITIETMVDGDDVAPLWRAMRTVGVQPSSFGAGTTWHRPLDSSDALPVEGTIDILEQALTLSIARAQPVEKGGSAGKVLRLAVHAPVQELGSPGMNSDIRDRSSRP